MGLDLERLALLLALGEELRSRGSWAGETHIQKASYFLQELLKVPLNFSFILYKHGPFSFDLHDALGAMESERLITWQPQPYPYGPTMIQGPLGSYLPGHTSMSQKYKDQIGFVAQHLASKKVVDLEKLATALFVTLDRSVAAQRRGEEISYRKQHIPLPEAEQAIRSVDEIIEHAVARGLIRKVAAANSHSFQIQV